MTATNPNLSNRVASQGVMLFSGFAVGQLCSFLRNALIAHTLARGNFGIAAALILLLQLVESLTEVGADRLVVQSPRGDEDVFVASAHSVLLARGVLAALALYLLAEPFAVFLNVAHATPAFQLIALVPLIKGFLHLDSRRAQRQLNNRPVVISDVVPQLATLLLTFPVLAVAPTYMSVAMLALFQAFATVAATHTLAERRYRIAFDRDAIVSLLSFGWPILLSAVPLLAVYQGDRVIIGRQYGMEALAGYSAAFMMTMVPSQIVSRIANSLMLPLFANEKDNPRAFAARYTRIAEATSVVVGLYLTAFILAGGHILPLAFGAQYAGEAALIAWLAVMWGLRMLQVVPGMALMAHGQTSVFLMAGLVRAAALPPAFVLAWTGAPLVAIAAVGALGELASFAYAAHCTAAIQPELHRRTWRVNAWLAGVAAVCGLTLMATPAAALTATTLLMLAVVLSFALTLMPSTRRLLLSIVDIIWQLVPAAARKNKTA
jgi:O-antigen/teichoic acid export membrane protein